MERDIFSGCAFPNFADCCPCICPYTRVRCGGVKRKLTHGADNLEKSFVYSAHRPVARFYGLREQNTFLWGQDFCFYYMSKTNFYGHNKMWVEQKI